MDKSFLWLLVLIGFSLLLLGLRHPPRMEKFLVFSFTGYCALFIGTIVVEQNMLTYPITLSPKYFDTSPLYELLLLPTVNMYFYHATRQSSVTTTITIAGTFAAVLTVAEVLLESHTNFIHYITWKWYDTFIGVFMIMMIIRTLVICLSNGDKKKR